ncbi:MAG: trypsin-like peptidase domain-containing protein [Actinomycetota bacterium]|nr:trypsin-like peptidase domain-containing protein [Actinomycetota bacterium]
MASAGFLLGAMLTVMGLGSMLGTDPLSLFKGDLLNKAVIQNTPSERLIAQGSVIDVAKKVQPSIVGIQTQAVPKDDSYYDAKTAGREVESVGSGVIMRNDGYIMTNNHVVNGATSILVTIGDEKVPATVVGVDSNSDIAVIKVKKPDLTAARFGAAKSLRVGELAVAIGSPFGFQHSVTAGVISALNRNVTVGGDIDRPKTYTNLIQTDAAINPGNSGGALINQKGEVVGINTLIYSTNGVSQGIGFAIPVEEAHRVANDLINQGQVRYPFIGIEGLSVDPALVKKRNLNVNQGAFISQVMPGGPADKADAKIGDVIVRFGEEKIKSMDDLVAAVRIAGINRTTTLRVIRHGSEEVLTITTAPRPASF